MRTLAALCLVWIAGCTDAMIFAHSRELLATYVSGDTAKLAGAFALANWTRMTALAAVIGSFVAATTLAAVARHRLGRWGAFALLAVIAALLTAAALIGGEPFPPRKILLIAGAMGALNQVLPGEPATTFVTGAWVRFGRAIAAARYAEAGGNALRWVAFLAGAGAGAVANARLGASGLALPAAGAGLGAVVAAAVAVTSPA